MRNVIALSLILAIAPIASGDSYYNGKVKKYCNGCTSSPLATAQWGVNQFAAMDWTVAAAFYAHDLSNGTIRLVKAHMAYSTGSLYDLGLFGALLRVITGTTKPDRVVVQVYALTGVLLLEKKFDLESVYNYSLIEPWEVGATDTLSDYGSTQVNFNVPTVYTSGSIGSTRGTIVTIDECYMGECQIY